MIDAQQTPAGAPQVLIAIADRFDDALIAAAIAKLSRDGGPVSLVAPCRRPVRSRQGACISADLTLNEALHRRAGAVLVILQAPRLVDGALTDPRLGRLANRIVARRGHVIATPDVALALDRSGWGRAHGEGSRLAVWQGASASGLIARIQAARLLAATARAKTTLTALPA